MEKENFNAQDLAEFMHNRYEEIAKKKNWKTQKKTQVAFKDLPEENKQTMLGVAQEVIYYFYPERFEIDDSTIINLKEIISEKEIIEDDDLEKLKKMRAKISFDSVSLAKVFVSCYDQLKTNLHEFKDEDDDYTQDLKRFLDKFSDLAEDMRMHLAEFEDGSGFGDHYIENNVNTKIRDNRESYIHLINFFFRIFGGED